MAYLSKAAILRAYKELSQLTSDPSAQGATQATSALRYIFALDEFYKNYDKPCDTSVKADRDKFIAYVGNVVAINNDLYTANFFNAIKDNTDYAVGSNFFSVNVVKNSLVSPNVDFTFPKRGNNPLFEVKGGKLIEKEDLLHNVRFFLHTPQLRNAFAIWLVRKDNLDCADIYSSILDTLKGRYSDALIEALQTDKNIIEEIIDNSFIDNPYSLSVSDFPKTISAKKETELLSPEELINKVRESFTQFVHLTNTHTNDFTDYISVFENEINSFLQKSDMGVDSVFQIIDIAQYRAILAKLEGDFPELAYLAKEKENHGTKYQVWTTHRYYQNYLTILAASDFFANLRDQQEKSIEVIASTVNTIDPRLLAALRAKPFLLLAGISGTGKSRVVKQLAFESCPDTAGLQTDKATPGNYCLVEVKPNWHDSTELLGYESQIGNEPRYVITPFVKFLAKAMLHDDVPFFLCLDEMNLAPVEQYFAEFLSVLESRKTVNGRITSEALIPADVFRKHGDLLNELFDIEKPSPTSYNGTTTADTSAHYGKETSVFDTLCREGMRIPQNLVVIGTVNMDETTHQFSRKVIDRAMTIEMNIEDGEQPFRQFFDDYRDLDYTDNPLPKRMFLLPNVSAAEALATLSEADRAYIVENLPVQLSKLNAALNGTPFKIAYRVQNELVLYFASLREVDRVSEPSKLLTVAIDDILMMKVLPRVEGDEDLLGKPLKELAAYAAPELYPNAAAKIAEMQTRLERGHFTSFWP